MKVATLVENDNSSKYATVYVKYKLLCGPPLEQSTKRHLSGENPKNLMLCKWSMKPPLNSLLMHPQTHLAWHYAVLCEFYWLCCWHSYSGGAYRLSFWYHMYGSNIGSLKVYLLTACSKKELFSESENQGNAWLNLQIALDMVDIQQHFQVQYTLLYWLWL